MEDESPKLLNWTDGPADSDESVQHGLRARVFCDGRWFVLRADAERELACGEADDLDAARSAALAEIDRRTAGSRRALADVARKEARRSEMRADPTLRTDAIDQRADRIAAEADRVRRFVRGADPKHIAGREALAVYAGAVREDLQLAETAVAVALHAARKADALRDGLPSKAGRQATAQARLRLAEAERDLATARLEIVASTAPIAAPARRFKLKRVLSEAAR